nr:hypothetical protein CFP56_27293 [Quercus suber]
MGKEKISSVYKIHARISDRKIKFHRCLLIGPAYGLNGFSELSRNSVHSGEEEAELSRSAYAQAFNIHNCTFEDVYVDIDLDTKMKEISEGIIFVKLSNSTISHIRGKWTHAFIVKVFGKRVGGPWFIGDQFLSIQPWEPDFNPATTNCSSIIIWARLLDLPIEYYDPLALTKIGQAIGLVLRVDTYTTSKS